MTDSPHALGAATMRFLHPRLAFVLAAVLLAGCAHPGGARAVDLQGHRGARGLMPENTLPAFRRALETGVDTLELDVGVTADGVVVVSHDAALNPAFTRDANGQWLAPGKGPLIRSLTLAQLQGYDVGRLQPGSAYARSFPAQQAVDGTRIPTLAAVFELAARASAGHVRFNIETKLDPRQPADTMDPEAMTRAVLKVIDRAGLADRVTLQSFDWRSLRLAHQLAPRIPTACLTVQTANSDNTRDPAWTAGLRLQDHGSVPALVKAAGCRVWSPNAGALTEPLLRQAHAFGLQVVPWTVNEPDDMDRLIGWGVDGLISDYPDRLRQAMQARGLPLPPAVLTPR